MRSISRHSARRNAARGEICAVTQRFEGLAIGPGECDSGIAGNPRREPMALERGELGEAPLDALVDVTEPLLEPQHLFTDDREAEVTRFDDARVHGTDGYFVHAIAFDANEVVAVDARARQRRRESSRPLADGSPAARLRDAATGVCRSPCSARLRGPALRVACGAAAGKMSSSAGYGALRSPSVNVTTSP